MENNFKEIAIVAARKAGKIHLKYFQKEFDTNTKSNTFDVVTTADIESEKAIKDIIKLSFPDHGFICEEGGSENLNSDYIWIIDPLDGTNNFASGLPIFCVSIGLAHKGEIIVGVIYDATRDELYHTEKGKGAYLNNISIKVSAATSLSEAVLITGFYYNRGKEMEDTLENMKIFMRNGIRGIRRFGSAALDLAYVASGRATGFWEFELSPWDFAAGILLVQEAGGKATNLDNKPLDILNKNYLISSNGLIHQQMMDILTH